MSASSQQGFQLYVFNKIYTITGGPGKPIHTHTRLSIHFEHSTLHNIDDYVAVLTDLFGKKITVNVEHADENDFAGYIFITVKAFRLPSSSARKTTYTSQRTASWL
jgi:hypothetical protein